LLVDDSAAIRAGVSALLGSTPDLTLVGSCADGARALTAAGALSPDIVLMDIAMPGLDGIAATVALLAARPATKAIILTAWPLGRARPRPAGPGRRARPPWWPGPPARPRCCPRGGRSPPAAPSGRRTGTPHHATGADPPPPAGTSDAAAVPRVAGAVSSGRFP